MTHRNPKTGLTKCSSDEYDHGSMIYLVIPQKRDGTTHG